MEAATAAQVQAAKEPAPQAGMTSMLGGLTRALTGRKERESADRQDTRAKATEAREAALDTPLDPKTANEPLEPGSGAPDLNAIMRRVRDERGPAAPTAGLDAGKSDFIAAARRAAQAAAAEAETVKHRTSMKAPTRGLRFADILKGRSKPVLIGATALLVVLAALQLGKAFLSGGDAEQAAVPAATRQAAAPNLTAAAIPPKADDGATAPAADATQPAPMQQPADAAAPDTASSPTMQADGSAAPATPRMASPVTDSEDDAASAPASSDQTVAAIQPDEQAASMPPRRAHKTAKPRRR